METSFSYCVVDVFTTVPLEGNPLAVFPDASGLDTATMQRIAREMNLSETTFILPRESDEQGTRVRIFTPMREMDFAGHPTIGTAFIMRRAGIISRSTKNFALRENIGAVPVRVDEGDDPILWLMTPPISKLAQYPRTNCAAMLGLDESRLVAGVPCEVLSAGNPSVFIAVDSPETVDEARLDVTEFLRIKDADPALCVFVFAPTPQGAYSRMFAPEHGVVEDPATGSVTGPLALFMMTHGLIASGDGTRFVSEQGTKMGRRSILHVYVHGPLGAGGIEVGGNVVEVAGATLRLPLAATVR